MTAIDYTERRGPIVIAVDECAELFATAPETSEEFERAVADVMALLATRRECAAIDLGEGL